MNIDITDIVHDYLDEDGYKPRMQYLIWQLHRDVEATFFFRNRSAFPLGRHIPIELLRDVLEGIRERMIPTEEEIRYLAETYGYTDPRYCEFLRGFRLPEFEVEHSADGEQFEIRSTGPWAVVTMAETATMRAVQYLYSRTLGWGSEDEYSAEGERRIAEKIAFFHRHPHLRIMEMGTRRRASYGWHRHVLSRWFESVPDVIFGTSNIALAREFGLVGDGTNAHEMPMGYQGIYWNEDEAADEMVSQTRFLTDWERLYGHVDDGRLLIALPDTYGSDYFERIFRPFAPRWRAIRPDSGDAFDEVDRWARYFEEQGIYPKEKLLLPSDGLTPEKMQALYEYHAGRTRLAFGWGTNSSNDVGIAPLSIVMKMLRVNGHDVAKLSDDPNKATGHPDAVARLKRIVRYRERVGQSVTY